MTDWIETITYVIAGGGAVMGYMILTFNKYAYLGARRKLMAGAVVALGLVLAFLFLIIATR
jgi:hypothetical protein